MEGARSPVPGAGRRLLKAADSRGEYATMPPDKLAAKLEQLEAQMYQHAENLEFEEAARLRDELERARRAGFGPGEDARSA